MEEIAKAAIEAAGISTNQCRIVHWYNTPEAGSYPGSNTFMLFRDGAPVAVASVRDYPYLYHATRTRAVAGRVAPESVAEILRPVEPEPPDGSPAHRTWEARYPAERRDITPPIARSPWRYSFLYVLGLPSRRAIALRQHAVEPTAKMLAEVGDADLKRPQGIGLWPASTMSTEELRGRVNDLASSALWEEVWVESGGQRVAL